MFGVKPLSERMMTWCQLVPRGQTSATFQTKFIIFVDENVFKMSPAKRRPFSPGLKVLKIVREAGVTDTKKSVFSKPCFRGMKISGQPDTILLNCQLNPLEVLSINS